MTFHPNMESSVHGFTVLQDLVCRAWPGVIADVWDVACQKDASGAYVSRAPRLFVLLDADEHTAIDLSLDPGCKSTVTLDRSNPMCFIPAEVQLWSRMKSAGHMQHLDLHLDIAALNERFQHRLAREALRSPRLSINDDRMMALARLIATECRSPSGLDNLYGDSLVNALMVLLGEVKPGATINNGRLPPRVLSRVTEYMDQHFAENVTLKNLADLAGLSPSYFSEAFKLSTGLPPHKWHLSNRIEKSKAMLETREASPTEVAVACGFSDQSHFTKVFRQFEGTTPAAWLRALNA